MPPRSCDKGFPCQTCLCCMCRCKNHQCFDQQALELPQWMQDRLYGLYPDIYKMEKGDAWYTKEVLSSIPLNSLYEQTTYKSDFCSERRFVDEFPLEQKPLVGTLKPFPGRTLKRSIYGKDFVLWDQEDQDLCRAKLINPLKTSPEKEDPTPDLRTLEHLRGYYCPPHCVGNHEEEARESCLLGLKEKFNLGPPSRKENAPYQKPDKAFETSTSYKLDYRDYAVSPRVPPTRRVDRPDLPPLSNDTSYRDSFPLYPAAETARPLRQPVTLTVGDGPMTNHSTSMMDFVEHHVQTRQPCGPPRQKFEPPKSRMSGETTTASAFPRWSEMPTQAEPLKQRQALQKPPGESVQPLLTAYQEDFGGINAALCPGSIVEKAGRNALWPRFGFKGDKRGHERFEYRGNDRQKDN